jgi:hypothetical protein
VASLVATTKLFVTIATNICYNMSIYFHHKTIFFATTVHCIKLLIQSPARVSGEVNLATVAAKEIQ